jgi:hypothetical protein
MFADDSFLVFAQQEKQKSMLAIFTHPEMTVKRN